MTRRAPSRPAPSYDCTKRSAWTSSWIRRGTSRSRSSTARCSRFPTRRSCRRTDRPSVPSAARRSTSSSSTATFRVSVSSGGPPNTAGAPSGRHTPPPPRGAPLETHDLAPAQWDYVALGHYHVAQQMADNAWYAGSLEYVSPNPWGQLQDEAERNRSGKCYLLVDLPAARVTPRPIVAARRHIDLPSIDAKGLTPKELDERIKDAVARGKPPIDDQIVRQLVFDVSRATARDLDHATIRGFKARALNYQLDLRRPEVSRADGGGILGAGGRRQALPDTVRAFLEHRPLDADLDRGEFVRLGVEYVGRGSEEDAGWCRSSCSASSPSASTRIRSSNSAPGSPPSWARTAPARPRSSKRSPGRSTVRRPYAVTRTRSGGSGPRGVAASK